MVEKMMHGTDLILMKKIGLQFFSEPEPEPEEGGEGATTPPVYVSDGSGGQKSKEEILKENGFSISQEEYENKAGALGEQDFYDKYGLDPDRDYLSQKKELEYNYMTEMATYGEKAERLYQIGLSNSGVSDIFQANAYSAYLSNVNTAAAERIEAKRKNALAYQEYRQGITDEWLEEERLGNQAYSQYEDKYNTQLKSDTGNAFNAALQSGLFTGEYTADGLTSLDYDKVSIYLQNMGYSSVVIEKVWEMLNKMDRQSVIDQRSLSAYKLLEPYLATWDPSDEDTMAYLRDYLKKQGYTDTNIQAAFDMANSYATATQPGSVIVGAVGPDGKAVTITPGENGTYTDANGNPITKNENGTYTDAEGNVVGYDMLEGEQARADQYLLNEISLEGKTLEQITAAINAGNWSEGAKQYLIAKATEKYNKLPENTTVTVGPDGKEVTITPGENGTYTDANGNPITKNENGTYTDAEGNVVGYDMSQNERESITNLIYQTDYQLFESIEELEAYIENFDLSPGAEQFAKDFATSKWNAKNSDTPDPTITVDENGNIVTGDTGTGDAGPGNTGPGNTYTIDKDLLDTALGIIEGRLDEGATAEDISKLLGLNGVEVDENEANAIKAVFDNRNKTVKDLNKNITERTAESEGNNAMGELGITDIAGASMKQINDFEQDLSEIEKKFGETEYVKTQRAAIRVRREAIFSKALENEANLEKAFDIVAQYNAEFTEEEWKYMDSGEREMLLINAAAEARKMGTISSTHFYGIVSDWVESEVAMFKGGESHVICESVSNMMLSLKEWKTSANMSDRDYGEVVGKIVKESGVMVMLQKELVIGKGPFVEKNLSNELDKETVRLWVNNQPVVIYNGKLYTKRESAAGRADIEFYWCEVSEDGLSLFIGPFDKRKLPGIYDLLVEHFTLGEGEYFAEKVNYTVTPGEGSGYYNGNPSQDKLQKEVTGGLNMENVDAGNGGDTNSGVGRGSVTGGGIGKGTLNGSQANK